MRTLKNRLCLAPRQSVTAPQDVAVLANDVCPIAGALLRESELVLRLIFCLWMTDLA